MINTEREGKDREGERVLQAACWNEQADGELYEPVCQLHHPFILRCEERGTARESEGRQEKCGREVIKEETEGGGRDIRVNEKRLSFNWGKDRESVSTGGRENERVLVRGADIATHSSTPLTVVKQEKGTKKTEGVEGISDCVWLGV